MHKLDIKNRSLASKSNEHQIKMKQSIEVCLGVVMTTFSRNNLLPTEVTSL